MGKLLKSYIFWTYQRGSFHYDIMVTAILLFLFVTPHFVDFKDRPVETVALHSSEVLVKEAGTRGGASRFLFQIRADDIGNAHTDPELKAAFLRVIEPAPPPPPPTPVFVFAVVRSPPRTSCIQSGLVPHRGTA